LKVESFLLPKGFEQSPQHHLKKHFQLDYQFDKPTTISIEADCLLLQRFDNRHQIGH
jgi:hypothetical protein